MSTAASTVRVVNLTPLPLQLATRAAGRPDADVRALAPFVSVAVEPPAAGTEVVLLAPDGRLLGRVPNGADAAPTLDVDTAYVQAGLRSSPRSRPWSGRLTVVNNSDEAVVIAVDGNVLQEVEVAPGGSTAYELPEMLASVYRVELLTVHGTLSDELLGMALFSGPNDTLTVTKQFLQAARAHRHAGEGNFDLVRSAHTPPPVHDRRYVRYGAEPTSIMKLNGQERSTLRVVLSGVAVVLDDEDASGFLKAYSGREDVQELIVHADTLIVRTGLRFPQATVRIQCRRLSFEGQDAFIDTSPIASEFRSNLLSDGDDGARAGDIHLDVLTLHSDLPDAKRFRAVGGKGQDPDGGGLAATSTVRHVKPITEQEWSDFFSHKRRKLMRSAVFKFPDPAAEDPKLHYMLPTPEWQANTTFVEIHNTYLFGFDERHRYLVGRYGSQDLPGKGPAGLTPGKPGTGGAGGNVYIAVGGLMTVRQLSDLRGGPSGRPMDHTEGGVGGSPTVARWLLIEATANKQPAGDIVQLFWSEVQAERGDDSGPGPRPDKPSGDAGQVEKVIDDLAPARWLSDVNLSLAVQYAKDLVAAGHPVGARRFLRPYLEALGRVNAATSKVTLRGPVESLALEATRLSAQADQYLDPYGNPPGWVPSLSLESTVQLYEQLLKSSMQELYSAYYIETLWLRKKDKQEAIHNLVKLLSDKTTVARDALVRSRNAMPALTDELAGLVAEMERLSNALEARRKVLLAQADTDAVSAQQKEDLAAVFKIAGAVVKAIPLPEPYQAAAGAVGGLLEVTGTFIDKGGDDEAFKALRDQVNAFAEQSTTSLVDEANRSIDAELRQDSPEIASLQRDALAAKKAKEALEGRYQEQAEQYKTLIENRKQVLDAKLEVLGSARSDAVRSANIAGKWTTEYQQFEAQQTAKLNAGTMDYLAKQAAHKDLQGRVKEAKEALAEKKEKLEEQKAARTKKVKDGIDKVKRIAASVQSIAQTVNKLAVSKSEINKKFDAALARLQTSDAEFLELVRQIKHLDEKKTSVATTLMQQQSEMGRHQEQIVKNLELMNEMRARLASTADALDPSALAYVQSIGQDAHEQLMRFLYYVGKAFEYYTVQAWSESYRDARKLFDSLRSTMEPPKAEFTLETDGTTAPADAQARLKTLLASADPRRDGGMLDAGEFALLRLVYESPLRRMGKTLANHLMSGAGKLAETKKDIVLYANDLKDLNRRIRTLTEGNQIPFSLIDLRQLDQGQERQRIANVRVTLVRGRRLKDKLPVSMSFRVLHQGKSVVRSNGKFYAFDPAGKAIAMDFGEQPVAARPMAFVTTAADAWEVSGDGEVLKGEAFSQPDNTGQTNLLSHLLGGTGDGASKLQSLSGFRPGMFSDYVLAIDFSPPNHKISFDEIRLQVTYEAGTVAAEEMLVCVDNDQGLAIPIETSERDQGGRSGAAGRYLAVYDRRQLSGDKTVEVRVPPTFGEYRHIGWIVDGDAADEVTSHTMRVGKSAYLTATYRRGDAAT